MNITFLKQYLKSKIKDIIQDDYLYSENLRKYQLDRINKIIKYAKENSLFYREFYKDIDFELKTLEDIKRLPILKKELFKKAIHENKILSIKFEKDGLSCGHTTGSTGTPLEMCFDKVCSKKRSLVQNRLWKKYGDISL